MLGLTATDFERRIVRLDGTPFSFDEPSAAVALQTGQHIDPVIAGLEVADRIRKWVSIRIWPSMVDGQIVGALTAFDDVTREVKEQRFLNLLNKVKDSAADPRSEAELFQNFCDAIVEEGRYALAWIGVASSEGGVSIASASGATEYLYDGIVSWWGSSESGMGPTGTALRTFTTQVANDLTTQPLFGPWRDRATQFNFNSLVVIPVTIGARKAVVSIYDEHADAFDELSIKGLEAIAREIESGVAASISLRQRQAAVEESTAAATALKKAELSLSESEQWFRTLVARSSDLIIVVDERGNFTYTNPIVDRLFGYEKYALFGRSIFELVHPSDRHLAQQAYLESLDRDGMDQPVVMRFLTSAGDWRHIECVLTNCLEDQAVKGMVGNGRDVTERTYLMRALNTLSEGSQVLVHAKDEEGLLADICQAIVTVGAYPLAWVGYVDDNGTKNVNVVASAGKTGIIEGLSFGWGDDELGLGPIGEAIRSDQTQLINNMLTMSTAPERFARVQAYDLRSMCAFPLRLPGETMGVMAIYSEQLNYFGPSEIETFEELAAELAYGIERMRDRDLLARNESVLREAEERFRLAFEHNMAPMLFSDLSDRVVAVNDSFCRMVGLHPGGVARSRFETVHPSRRRRHHRRDPRSAEFRADRSGALRQALPAQRRPDHRGRSLKSPARDATGKILYFVSSERDITEERALAAQLSHQALHDSLTGLANRALFEDRLTQAHARVVRQGGFGARPPPRPRRLQGRERRLRTPRR